MNIYKTGDKISEYMSKKDIATCYAIIQPYVIIWSV